MEPCEKDPAMSSNDDQSALLSGSSQSGSSHCTRPYFLTHTRYHQCPFPHPALAAFFTDTLPHKKASSWRFHPDLLKKSIKYHWNSKKIGNHTARLIVLHMWAPRSHLALKNGQTFIPRPTHTYVQMHNNPLKKLPNIVCPSPSLLDHSRSAATKNI